MITVKTPLDERVLWKLEVLAEKEGLDLGVYIAQVATREVERPVVRVDWWDGAANRMIKLMDHGRTDDEIADLLGVSIKTVRKRRALWRLVEGTHRD